MDIANIPFIENMDEFLESLIPLQDLIDWAYTTMSAQNFLTQVLILVAILGIAVVGIYHWLKLATKIAFFFLVIFAVWWVFTSGILTDLISS